MSIMPVTGKITSEYGFRVLNGIQENHKGIDIAVPVNTSIGSIADGVIKSMGYSNARGNYVVVDHVDGYSSLYQHLSKATVAQGAKVSMGQVIGLSGNTGNSTGPHLHYEVYKDGSNINPKDFTSALKNNLGIMSGFDTDGILGALKYNWWMVVGGLVLLSLIKK